jgi:hypothetical protein
LIFTLSVARGLGHRMFNPIFVKRFLKVEFFAKKALYFLLFMLKVSASGDILETSNKVKIRVMTNEF